MCVLNLVCAGACKCDHMPFPSRPVSMIPGNIDTTNCMHSSCGCGFCLKGEHHKWESISEFSKYPWNIHMMLHKLFMKTNKKKKTPVDDNDDEDHDHHEMEAKE